MSQSKIFQRRRAGILLHPTSLPGKFSSGTFGEDAYRFVDFLAAAGQTIWQLLPLGPTHHHGSPYQCVSAHAGDPKFINIDNLVARGWLDDVPTNQSNDHILKQAYHGFNKLNSVDEQQAFYAFLDEHKCWLTDFALYQALRKNNDNKDWAEWPTALRDREPQALQNAHNNYHDQIRQNCFEQFVFFEQWLELKAYANDRGIYIFGDLPIFVSYESVDVWAKRQYFELDDQGRPVVVAGVPPDYFSATGQKWGNPHYRWQQIQQDGFDWWIDRLATQLKLFDFIRIDHFRGFEAFWEIPADQPDATQGKWVKAPGDELFATLQQHFGSLPLVAEDLGYITQEVYALRDQYNLPGMKILQFAFDGDSNNPYLPHNIQSNSIVYTGTHDNDTTLGWYQSLPEEIQHKINGMLGNPIEAMPWPLMRCAYESAANMALIPMQDILALGSEHRTNTPGTTIGNWRWRFEWDQVTEELTKQLNSLTTKHDRIEL